MYYTVNVSNKIFSVIFYFQETKKNAIEMMQTKMVVVLSIFLIQAMMLLLFVEEACMFRKTGFPEFWILEDDNTDNNTVKLTN